MSTVYFSIEDLPWTSFGDATLKKCSICCYGGDILQQVNAKSYASGWHSTCKKSLILSARPSLICRMMVLLVVYQPSCF